MKKTFTLFRVLLTLVLLCGVSSAWGESITETYTLSVDDNGKTVTTNDVQWAVGSGAITKSGTNCKLTGTITVTLPEGAMLTSIEITKSSTWGSGATVVFASGTSTLETFTSSSTFAIDSNQSDRVYTFTKAGDSSKNAWVKEIKVTYQINNSDPKIVASDVTLESDATSGEIAYTVANPVAGQSLTAVTDAEWISNIAVTSEKVTFDATKNTGDARTAQITLKYDGADDKVVKVTQSRFVLEYVTLPFEWAGGSKSDFIALDGVVASGLGTDYAASNAPYLIKLDGTGDYFQFKTNEPIGLISIDVKMIGGASASSLKVQGSADGINWSDIETLSISGNQNDVLNLKTTNIPDKAYRYVKFVFTKGSNVGVGAITIKKALQTQDVTITSAGYATAYIPFNATVSNEEDDVKAYFVTVEGTTAKLNEIEGTIPANTGMVLKGAAGTVTFTESVATLANVEGNLLIGTADKDGAIFAKDNTTYYILSSVGGKVGFYWDASTNNSGATANCAQYKAVLAVPASTAPSFFTFDDATAINVIDNAKVSGVRYNLNGQAVGADYKGIVIVNGKKMFNK